MALTGCQIPVQCNQRRDAIRTDMLSRHRTRGIVGVAGWFVLLAAFVTVLIPTMRIKVSEERSNFFPLVATAVFLAQFIWFFWAGCHLARAKGYSEAVTLLGLLCFVGQFLTFIALLLLPDKHARLSVPKRARKRKDRYGSALDRIMRYRRNTLLGIVLGLCGITLGISLVLFPDGISSDPSNENLPGMLVFLGGYCGLISGCWWWLKAKQCNEEVVLVGLAPVLILFIPYVRLVFVTVPSLLPLSMAIMPLILLVVVMALPDHLGPWNRGH
jgi:hypothetical protein